MPSDFAQALQSSVQLMQVESGGARISCDGIGAGFCRGSGCEAADPMQQTIETSVIAFRSSVWSAISYPPVGIVTHRSDTHV